MSGGKMFEKLIYFIIYISSVAISLKYANSYWVVGPVFGLVVITLDSASFRSFVASKHVAYLAASSLIYALVYHISRQNWNHGSDLMDSLAGSFPAAVITGSILLPLAHRVFLSAVWKKVWRTTVILIAAYYFVTVLSWANDASGMNFRVNFLMILIAAWQGLYLYSFYIPMNRPPSGGDRSEAIV